MAKSFRVKLKKSTIGGTDKQKDSIRCLGLKRLHHEVIVKDNPAIRGLIRSVQHLVEVKVEK